MKATLQDIIAQHLTKLGFECPDSISLDHPRLAEHGDFSTNVAMVLSKKVGMKPLELANRLADSLREHQEAFSKIEVKGPGFINLFLKNELYHQALKAVWENPQELKLPQLGGGKRVLVEFVSANPTGPMHIGHGRNAVVGDCLARLLEAVGFKVTREFYINDHGVQVKTLGLSGLHYYRLLTEGEKVSDSLAKDVYQGVYLEELVAEHQKSIAALNEEPVVIGKLLAGFLLDVIKQELKRLDIVFDRYFSESSLYHDGKIDKALEKLRESGFTYEQDGALWFKTTEFGDDKDRVLIKADGSYTYLTPDIAYHRNKFEQNFDLYLNVLGADHGGYVSRIKAAVKALGYDPNKLECLLMQLVNLKRGDQAVSMSKRTGDYVTLHEVIDEVGSDAVRFFFMMRSHHATLDFDLELAKQKNSDNPVYYIQYAHARMSSIFVKAAEAGYPSAETIVDADLKSLVLPEELELVKTLCTYPDLLQDAAEGREPHRVAFYLMDLAKLFQNYYTRGKTDSRYRVISEDRETTLAKLFLVKTLREVFRLGLKILGVSAPEKMEREGES